MTHSTLFSALHQQAVPLFLPNVWDAASAVFAERGGALAIATSSAALAWSHGYPDGEKLPLAELFAALRRILRVVTVPVTVDLEQGYSQEPAQVALLVQQLADMGIAGVNLEDGEGPAALLAEKIHACRLQLAGQPLFINARTDVYLAGLASGAAAINDCRTRSTLYQTAGANCLFIPGLTDLSIAAAIAAPIAEADNMQQAAHQQRSMVRPLPLNLMGWPANASTSDLHATGVCRISMGPALFIAAYQQLYQAAATVPPAQPLSYDLINHWLARS